MDIVVWQDRLKTFAEERDWVRFHSPKNLATALSVEASELVEIFQWMTEHESGSVMGTPEAEHVREELADVLIYLLRLADVLGVNLESAVDAKISANARRYQPVPPHDQVAKSNSRRAHEVQYTEAAVPLSAEPVPTESTPS